MDYIFTDYSNYTDLNGNPQTIDWGNPLDSFQDVRKFTTVFLDALNEKVGYYRIITDNTDIDEVVFTGFPVKKVKELFIEYITVTENWFLNDCISFFTSKTLNGSNIVYHTSSTANSLQDKIDQVNTLSFNVLDENKLRIIRTFFDPFRFFSLGYSGITLGYIDGDINQPYIDINSINFWDTLNNRHFFNLSPAVRILDDWTTKELKFRISRTGLTASLAVELYPISSFNNLILGSNEVISRSDDGNMAHFTLISDLKLNN